jgi:hypothetical protein
MGLLEILALVKAALEFPGEVMQLVNLLRKTPQEQHADLLKAMQVEADNFAKTGRPSW